MPPAPTTADYDWSDWFDAAKSYPPRDTLLRALLAFDAQPAVSRDDRLAVDLGCGDGRDTVEMLRRGWRVIAIDASQAGLDRLTGALPETLRSRVEPVRLRFQDDWLSRLPRRVELLNASFAIPHCRPEEFPGIWRQVTDAIAPGGRFAGQLFGPDDAWARKVPTAASGPSLIWDAMDRVFHTADEARRLLSGFDIEFFDEVNRLGNNAQGLPKHWHVHHIVARKR